MITLTFLLHIELALSSSEVTRNINIYLINLKQDLAWKSYFTMSKGENEVWNSAFPARHWTQTHRDI